MMSDFEKYALSKGISSNTLNEFNKYNFKGSYIDPYVIEERDMHVTTLSVFSRLLIDRIIFLGTDINEDSANIVSAQLLWLEQQSDNDIMLYISSPGGSIYAGYNILDSMNYVKNDISTVSMGMVASMASIIASSGTKGKRFILPHARFLIHQPLGGTKGQCSDIQIEAKEIQTLKEELTQILMDNSGQTYETIEKMCDRDTILTAKQAVDYGFIDEIVKKKEKKNVLTNLQPIVL